MRKKNCKARRDHIPQGDATANTGADNRAKAIRDHVPQYKDPGGDLGAIFPPMRALNGNDVMRTLEAARNYIPHGPCDPNSIPDDVYGAIQRMVTCGFEIFEFAKRCDPITEKGAPWEAWEAWKTRPRMDENALALLTKNRGYLSSDAEQLMDCTRQGCPASHMMLAEFQELVSLVQRQIIKAPSPTPVKPISGVIKRDIGIRVGDPLPLPELLRKIAIKEVKAREVLVKLHKGYARTFSKSELAGARKNRTPIKRALEKILAKEKLAECVQEASAAGGVNDDGTRWRLGEAAWLP